MARDYHIISLKEQLHRCEQMLSEETTRNHHDTNEIIKHITGMNRITHSGPDPSNNIHSIERSLGIRSKIAKAESQDKESGSAQIAQRKKEYNERIAALIKPDVEVVEENKA